MPLKDTNGQTFLTITCIQCHAVYRAYRRISPNQVIENTNLGLINFCMFCGSPNPMLSIENNEQDWIDGVADKYNIPSTKIRELLAVYESAPPTAKLSWQKLLLGAK